MNILLTGGAGYIGSHTCISLIEAGHDVVIVDNLSNSSEIVLDRILKITNYMPFFYNIDINDKRALSNVFEKHSIDAVIHLAGLKAVNESILNPEKYYENNVVGTINLVNTMKSFGCKKLVFSSSATVYGVPEVIPLVETAHLKPLNPYGRSKLIVEDFLSDIFTSDNEWKIITLRYFNPIGAHKSGLIGEDPKGIPSNIMPFICQVASKKLERLSIFGNDFNTNDGTGIRDFIHIQDLSDAHLRSLENINSVKDHLFLNIGTGKGYSVLQLVETFEKVTSKNIPYIFTDRRDGDIDICFANADKANKFLDWSTSKDLKDMCRDAWRWQLNNPKGYN
jgi:UDP-glucose 4-epimerase